MAVGAASGVLAMVASVATLYFLLPVDPSLVDIGARLGYALKLNAFAILPLLVSLIVVGNNRFLSEAIDPTRHKESLATEINGRVADNTLQQFMLFLVGTLALSVSLTGPQMRAIPAATVVFVVARIAFWIGYRIHPLYRAFGMAATAYLNVGLIGFALWRAVG
ncbi:MAG: MAPEG family protein [Caulobacterales bacterium]